MADPEERIGRAAALVGKTVRRAAGPWQPAVHALLRHLAAANVLAPEVLGTDSEGREVLGWIAGESGQTAEGMIKPEVQSDEVLVQMAQLLRRVHDATTTFQGKHLDWDPVLKDPATTVEVVCHNDVSYHNTIFVGRRPAAFIDWELAAPGRRLWDLAYAAWSLVPLCPPTAGEAMGWLSLDQPRRLRLLIDAYGLGDERRDLLGVIYERQRSRRRQMRLWVANGMIPRFDESDPLIDWGSSDYIETIHDHLETALAS